MLKIPLWAKKWWIQLPILMIAILFILFTAFILSSSGGTHSIQVNKLNDLNLKNKSELTLLSINMAHGRANGIHQFLLSENEIRQNLKKIGEVINREEADIVGLQEADSPSWWSGGFSHVDEVAKQTKMSFNATAKNIDGFGLAYGTAMLSRIKTTQAKQITFDGNYPTPSKGFIITSHELNGFVFDIVSVHLDFASSKVRKAQLERVKSEFIDHEKPLVIMGDFNTNSENGQLKSFMDDLNLKTWDFENNDLVTFPTFKDRIDWVFVSHHFEITSHTILDDVVSDHNIVKVILKLKRSPH